MTRFGIICKKFYVVIKFVTRSGIICIKSYVVGGDEPSHFCGGRQLSIDEAFDLRFGPSVVDEDDGEHEPFPGEKEGGLIKHQNLMLIRKVRHKMKGNEKQEIFGLI